MADAIIDIVGQDDLPVIVDLYNQIYRPPRDVDAFRRRFRGRYNVLRMIARVKDRPVGFFVGFPLGIYVEERRRLGPHAPAWRSTRQALRAIGLSILIELSATVVAAAVWLAIVLV